jgi:hypothetical protein
VSLTLPNRNIENYWKYRRSLMPSSSQNELLRVGWFSPRMRHQLIYFAKTAGGNAFLHGDGILSYLHTNLSRFIIKESFIHGYIYIMSRGYSQIFVRWPFIEPCPRDAPVGRRSSLHYYYLAFIVLTYLAYLIAVNTSYRSSLGTTDPAYNPLVALDFDYSEKVRKAHFLLLLISRISSHSIVPIRVF